MVKFCVFCGKLPQDKNREHIIPKWLTKLTKSEDKLKTVGVNFAEGEEINLNLFSFTYPACTSCNNDFSNIEGSVKTVVEKILIDDYVTGEELLLLLDWFDKIRICLWLSLKIRNGEIVNWEPKFFVNTRVGLKDRMLAITNTYDGTNELWLTGMHTLGFIISPTCFTMKINNIIFNNCSMDFVVSEQLGFPYPLCERKNSIDPNLQDFLLTKGKEKLAGKLFKTTFYKDTTIICQPIFTDAQNPNYERYNSEYVKNNCYDWGKGKGKLFISHEGITYSMEIDDEISFASKIKTPKKLKRNTIALGFQLEVLTSRKIVFENDVEQKNHKMTLQNIIDFTIEQIKHYDY